MPELPEVETVRVQLWKKLQGKTIAKIEVFHDKTVGDPSVFKRKLRGLTIKDIDRIGKLLIFSFSEKDSLFMLSHLKMTGQFFFIDNKGRLVGGGHSLSATDTDKFPGRHTRVAFHLNDQSVLYFNDMRLFGYLKITDKEGLLSAKSHYGPEPIDANFDIEKFTDSLRKKKKVVKAALLDQTFVAGLGNIYVDEALFLAGVRPQRRADRLTKKEATLIGQSAKKVLQEAITHGGTTFQHFLDAEGNMGNHSQYLQVFGRQGQKCPRCGGTIKKTRVAGRGTHYCPDCQK